MNRPDHSIIYVLNTPGFFLSHRLELAIKAKNSGYKVSVVTARGDGIKEITNLGLDHYIIPFSRSGHNLFEEFNVFIKLILLLWRLKPDLVHLVTIKPILYGGLASRILRIRHTVCAISGLGTAFTSGTFLTRFRKKLIFKCYKFIFNQKNLMVILQNTDDIQTLQNIGILKSDQICLINGSGVNLRKFKYVPETRKLKSAVVVMASRLLRDKGVYEFVEAANLLKARDLNVRMLLIGEADEGNPTSVTRKEISTWDTNGVVEILGFRVDIAKQYAEANIVCLPSYREGLPKSLIEAAAIGRCVVTTDVPGCREAIIPGKTGCLVPARDPLALANSIEELLNNDTLRINFGKAGRVFAENQFDVNKIVQKHISLYETMFE
ncbi:glycosyltransferase family 4 protein, partial [Amylibacter sp.]|nr:glycosyltransferase family 4 protein [Amylibacter sp.]